LGYVFKDNINVILGVEIVLVLLGKAVAFNFASRLLSYVHNLGRNRAVCVFALAAQNEKKALNLCTCVECITVICDV